MFSCSQDQREALFHIIGVLYEADQCCLVAAKGTKMQEVHDATASSQPLTF
jgi:hypothetical protein